VLSEVLGDYLNLHGVNSDQINRSKFEEMEPNIVETDKENIRSV